MLIVCGYAFILLIDRVIIDSHHAVHALETTESVTHAHEHKKTDISTGHESSRERSESQMKRSSSMSGSGKRPVYNINEE